MMMYHNGTSEYFVGRGVVNIRTKGSFIPSFELLSSLSCWGRSASKAWGVIQELDFEWTMYIWPI